MKKAGAGAIPKTSLADVLHGTVTSENPIKINIESRFEVGSSFLILSPFCYKLEINGEKVWDGLKKGDKVNLLRCQDGQKYYVLDRGAI